MESTIKQAIQRHNEEIGLIKQYLEGNMGSIQKIVRFQVTREITENIGDIEIKPYVSTFLRITIDVPLEERKNPFLKEDYFISLTRTGKIRKVTHYCFGREEEDKTKHFKIMLGEKRHYFKPLGDK